MEEEREEGSGNRGIIYVETSNGIFRMLYPLRLCRLVSGESECKWSRFLGEVGHSHRPMLGLGYAVAKQVFFVVLGPWG